MADPEPTRLEGRGLTVRYPAVVALDRVDFALDGGEIHALMGENGAGKSTLINLLSGITRPTSGSLHHHGRLLALRGPRDAEAAGISTVHQELDLVPTLSVADNVCLGRYPGRFGLLDRRAIKERAERALARLGLRLDIDRSLADFPIAIQQLVAVCRALDIDAKILILDEPTSSLDPSETERLFTVVRRLRAQGLGIVFVSHFLDQVYRLADRITVLRNGGRVGTWPVGELPRPALIEAMTGRTLTAEPASVPIARTEAEPVLAWRDLGTGRGIAPSSGVVHRGEAVGFAGLRGSGRTELARLIVGADRADLGEVRVADQLLIRGSIRSAIAAGLGFTPEDRQTQGLILDLSVEENIVLALQARRGSLRPIARDERRRLTGHYITTLAIRTPDSTTPVGHLSGGNQQKVLLARWLAIQPRVLIFDEPTRGIDVGARAEIEGLITSLKRQGLGVVVISEELDEVVRLADRVMVLRDRRVVGELVGAEVSESAILSLVAAEADR